MPEEGPPVTNLPVPTLPNEVPGNFMTSSLINAIGLTGLGFTLNVPLAVLYQATTQSIASGGSGTALTFDSESADTYSGHSTTTNSSRYTGQVPGYYLVYGIAVFGPSATGYRAATIGKNGSQTVLPGAFGVSAPITGINAAATALSVVQMNGTTDYVEIYAQQNSGGSLATPVTSDQQSAMTVWWLHS